MAHDVFISYSRADVKIADDICKAFDDSGISYWIDRGGITSGEAFHEAIVNAIKDSKITVFISSVNSNMSEYTIKEIVIAFKNKKHIIPFCIDEEPFAAKLEFYLCDLDQLAYYMEKEFAVQKLVGDILRLLNKIPEKSESVPVTPLNLQRPTENKSQCLLKIRPNQTCNVWVDGDCVVKAEANQITKLPLNKGTFWLEFVSEESELDKYSCEYTLANPEELISVDLINVCQKRKYWENLTLFSFKDSNKYGYKDEKGNIVISAKYNFVHNFFEEGLAAVQLDDEFGYIDKTDQVIIPFKYEGARSFKEGLAAVRLNGKWGFIDKYRKELTSFKYDMVSDFEEGLAPVKFDGKWGFIDMYGREIVSVKYDNRPEFHEERAAVQIGDKWGYINKLGEEIVSVRFEKVTPFNEGLAIGSNENHLEIMNWNGGRVRKVRTDIGKLTARTFHEGIACIILHKPDSPPKHGFISRDKQIVPIRYSASTDFKEGLAGVKYDKWGFIDKTGKEVIPRIYDYVYQFCNDKAKVELNGETFYIDKSGNRI